MTISAPNAPLPEESSVQPASGTGLLGKAVDGFLDLFAGRTAVIPPQSAEPKPQSVISAKNPAPVTTSPIDPPKAGDEIGSAPANPPPLPLERRVARLLDIFDFSRGSAASTPREGPAPLSLPLPDQLPPHPETTPAAMALSPTEATERQVPVAYEVPRPRTAASLVVGIRHRLGKEPDGDGSCFTRTADGPRFCIEHVRWPTEVEPFFTASTPLYKGSKSIVRYRDSVADSIYGVFPAENFDRIAAHFARVFGGPDERHSLPMAVIGNPNARNTAYVWRDAAREGAVIFELRRNDDLRGIMPDTEYGAFRLYRKDALPMFETVEMSDFVVHAIRASATGR